MLRSYPARGSPSTPRRARAPPNQSNSRGANGPEFAYSLAADSLGSAEHSQRPRHARTNGFREKSLGLSTILLIVLILLLIGALPTWPHSHNWGYGPSCGVTLIVVILLILLLLGRVEPGGNVELAGSSRNPKTEE